MCHDQLHARSDGLGGAVGRHGQAGHEALQGGGAIAQEQAHIIPLGGKSGRCPVLQEGERGSRYASGGDSGISGGDIGIIEAHVATA